MRSGRLIDRLAKLERQCPDSEEAWLAGMASLEEMLRKAELRNGPLPPQTPEEEARTQVFVQWLIGLAEGRE